MPVEIYEMRCGRLKSIVDAFAALRMTTCEREIRRSRSEFAEILIKRRRKFYAMQRKCYNIARVLRGFSKCCAGNKILAVQNFKKQHKIVM